MSGCLAVEAIEKNNKEPFFKENSLNLLFLVTRSIWWEKENSSWVNTVDPGRDPSEVCVMKEPIKRKVSPTLW